MAQAAMSLLAVAAAVLITAFCGFGFVLSV